MITDLLLEGKENATPREKLKNILCVNERVLYRLIESERRKGAAILSKKEDGGGYYLPANEKERAEYLNTAMNDIISNLRTYHAVKYDGQRLDKRIESIIRSL